MTTPQRVLLATTAAVVVSLAGTSASLAAGHATKAHQPSELWRAFPLGRTVQPPASTPSHPATTHVTPSSTGAPPAAATTRGSRQQGGQGSRVDYLAPLILAFAGLAIAAFLLRLQGSVTGFRRRTGVAERPGGESSLGDRQHALQALAELHDTGLLDDEQFAARSAEILDGAPPGRA